jgi:chromosome segregation protein
MDAISTCEIILNQLKATNLNFVLQETPFSAFITIRKSFIKSFHRNVPGKQLSSEKKNQLSDENIKALVAENEFLKSELKKEKNRSCILEEELNESKMKIDGLHGGFKQSEMERKKLDNLVLEKEKEIQKVKQESKAQMEENVSLRDKLKTASKSLKNSDKEANKAVNKCDNLEDSVTRLKAEKASLEKLVKNHENSKKREAKKITNMQATGAKDSKILE